MDEIAKLPSQNEMKKELIIAIERKNSGNKKLSRNKTKNSKGKSS